MSLKSNNISKLGVIVLSIVLLTGISLVPTLQIRVQGQVQQQQSPAPPAPGITPPALDAAGGGEANQTGGGGAVNQSAMVMIHESTMTTMMGNLQQAMTAVDSGNKDAAMTALNSVDQKLKSAANASGVSVEITAAGDTSGDGDGGGGGDNG